MFSKIGFLARSLLVALTINYASCSKTNKHATKLLKTVWIVKDVGEILLVKCSLVKCEFPILRTPSFVCPIEKRVQGSLFFIKTIKTGRNGTVRFL